MDSGSSGVGLSRVLVLCSWTRHLNLTMLFSCSIYLVTGQPLEQPAMA